MSFASVFFISPMKWVCLSVSTDKKTKVDSD